MRLKAKLALGLTASVAFALAGGTSLVLYERHRRIERTWATLGRLESVGRGWGVTLQGDERSELKRVHRSSRTPRAPAARGSR